MSNIINPYKFSGGSESRIVAVQQVGQPYIFYSSDSGSNWSSSTQLTDVASTSLYNIRIARGNHNYMLAGYNSASTENIPWFSDDAGATWSYGSPSTTYATGAAISSNGQYMVCPRAYTTEYIYVSEDYGSTWDSYDSTVVSMDQPRAPVMKSDGSKTWYFSSYTTGVCRYATDWTSSTSGSSYPSKLTYAACGADDLSYIYTGTVNTAGSFVITKTDDEFATYSSPTVATVDGGATYIPRSICCDSTGQYVMLHYYSTYGSNHGRVYVSSDYGESWTQKLNSYESDLYGGSVDQQMVSSNGQFMVCPSAGTNGTYYYSDDYGSTWSVETITGFGSYKISTMAVENI